MPIVPFGATTAALTAELERPDIDLVATVRAFAGKVFCGYGSNTWLGILASPSHSAASIPKADANDNALAAIDAASERWGERLPGDPDESLAS